MSYVDNVEIIVMIDADSAFNGRIAASMFMKVIPQPMKNVSPVKCSMFGEQVARRIGKEISHKSTKTQRKKNNQSGSISRDSRRLASL